MSQPIRLSLRAPPHLPFVQGYPGIPASPGSPRAAPSIQGTIELRVNQSPCKAKWVRIELRKHEGVPAGFPTSSHGEQWEHIGEICTLWQPPNKLEFSDLETADFKFFLPLPDGIPPSVEISRGAGVWYELVAACCYRKKGGMFKSDSSPIVKISEPIRIIKHELLSAWPLYQIPDGRAAAGAGGAVTLMVQRPFSAIGPTDRVLISATLRSQRPQPFKLKGFECQLSEIITAFPPTDVAAKRKSKMPQAVSKSRIIATARTAVDESVGRGGEKSARIEMDIPPDKLLMTLRGARSIDLRYELEVRAVCDGTVDVRIANILYTVGALPRLSAQQTVKEIGLFPPLSPGQSDSQHQASTPHTMQPSHPTRSDTTPPQRTSIMPNGPTGQRQSQLPNLYPGPSPQIPPHPNATGMTPSAGPAFVARDDPRRHSSMSTSTTTTTTTDFNPTTTGQRPFSTMPNQRDAAPMVFPTANPAGGLDRAASVQYSLADSTGEVSSSTDAGRKPELLAVREEPTAQESKRASSATTATFGRWDQDLKNSMQSSSRAPTTSTIREAGSSSGGRQPPLAWPTAEDEKTRLYAAARAKAVASQQAGGVSLERIGLQNQSSVPTDAPPDYFPVNASPPGAGSPTTAGPSNGAIASKPVAAFASAAEEKDQQRQRYDAAQRRVASDGSSGPSSSSTVTSPIIASGLRGSTTAHPFMAAQGTPSPPASASPASPQASEQPQAAGPAANDGSAAPSSITEKEQMRRYYEARDRMEKAQRGEGSSGPSDTQSAIKTTGVPGPSGAPAESPSVLPPTFEAPPSGPSTASKGYMSAAEEKDLMKKRYDEASFRVASTQGAGSSSTNGSSSSAPPPAVEPAVAGWSASTSQSKAYLSAAEEKEQMRKRYEVATSRVASIQGSGPSNTTPSLSSANATAGTSAAPSDSPPPFDSSEAGPSTGVQGAAQPQAYLSAAEEKDQMRKRYQEATSRVSKPQDVSNTSSLGSPIMSGSSTTGARDMDDNVSANAGPSETPTTNGSLRSYPTAEEEKDQMRKRYQNATAAVERKGAAPALPARSSTTMPPALGTVADGDVRPSQTNGGPQDATSKSDSAVPLVPTPPPALAKGPNIVRSPPAANAPPPLPSRPPADYVNLLHLGRRVNGGAPAAAPDAPNTAAK